MIKIYIEIPHIKDEYYHEYPKCLALSIGLLIAWSKYDFDINGNNKYEFPIKARNRKGTRLLTIRFGLLYWYFTIVFYKPKI